MDNERRKVLQNVANKETTGGVIWIVVAVIQILVGIAFYWVALIIGIWNITVGISRITSAKKIEERKDIVEQYEKSLTSTIVFIVINVFIGGLIGVIGAIYDLTIRSYVLNNRDIIDGNVSVSNTNSNNKYEDLEKLMKLKENGVITEVEFEVEKAKLLR